MVTKQFIKWTLLNGCLNFPGSKTQYTNFWKQDGLTSFTEYLSFPVITCHQCINELKRLYWFNIDLIQQKLVFPTIQGESMEEKYSKKKRIKYNTALKNITIASQTTKMIWINNEDSASLTLKPVNCNYCTKH